MFFPHCRFLLFLLTNIIYTKFLREDASVVYSEFYSCTKIDVQELLLIRKTDYNINFCIKHFTGDPVLKLIYGHL